MSYPFARILGVTDIYPSAVHPEEGVFIQSLFRQFHSCGYPVRVLNPRSWLRMAVTGERLRSTETKDVEVGETVLTPHYLTVSSRLFSFNYIGGRLTLHFYRRSVQHWLPKAVKGCDWVYAHFFRSGWAAIDICGDMQRDCFVALGESNLEQVIDIVGHRVFAETLLRFAGVIAVSRANEKLCREHCPSIGDRLIYLPNAVDHTLFFPRDRGESRRRLGLPSNARIVVFCGYFIKRKGIGQLLSAIENTPNVYGIFLGRGPESPKGARVLYAGPTDHPMVPWWLSAADVFALPSLAEGMSNAIVEALACGLPVVVSDLPFNHEFLDTDCAIFVDPFSAREISSAILSLFEDQRCYASMSAAARRRADQFKLESRAARILDFVSGHSRRT